MQLALAVFCALVAASAVSAAPAAVRPLSPGAGYRLISFGENLPPFWLSDAEVETLLATKAVPDRVLAFIHSAPSSSAFSVQATDEQTAIGFVDVTDLDPTVLAEDPVVSAVPIPRGPVQTRYVESLIPKIDISGVKKNLEQLSAFFTRYYKSSTGADSAQWIFDKVSSYAKLRSRGVTVQKFIHPNFNQFSIIARIEGSSNLEDVVILGAHQDSINQSNPSNGRSPGADDDGSGSVTILEAFRVLVSDPTFNPSLPVEFMWFAGEEGGLIGSGLVANDYKSKGRKVAGMFQLDMTGYRATPNQAVKVVTDFVDAPLTEFTRSLAKTYTSFTLRDSPCGYGCSDHASWNKAGYRSATTFEPQTNPKIHTASDDLNLVDYDLVQEFVKFGISYVVELSYSS